MNLKIFAIALTLALTLSVLAVTMQVTRTAYADKDSKTKFWIGGGGSVFSQCSKDVNCKGLHINKDTKDTCESLTPDKCKQEQSK